MDEEVALELIAGYVIIGPVQEEGGRCTKIDDEVVAVKFAMEIFKFALHSIPGRRACNKQSAVRPLRFVI